MSLDKPLNRGNVPLRIPPSLAHRVYYQTDDVVVYHGDNREILADLEAESVNIVITSPPYNTEIVGNGKVKPSGFMKEPGMAAWLGKMTSGYEDTTDEMEYQLQQQNLLRQIERVLVDGGSVWYNHKLRWRDKVLISPLTWLQDVPLNIRTEIVWDRGVGTMLNAKMPYLQDERIYWMYKGRKWEWNQDAVGLGTVWRIPPQRYKEHACVFPERLVGNCFRCVAKPGHVVLDPYAGSGTVAAVAPFHGCQAILIEREEKYCEVIVERLRQTCIPMGVEAGWEEQCQDRIPGA